MFNAYALYRKRLSTHIKEISRYLRYIFNGHTVIALLFLVSALAYYYQEWLTTLPENFPTAIVIGIIFGLTVSYSPVRTLVKEPDLVFLITAEHKMGTYFRLSLLYSFIVQLYIILLAVAALAPLYFASFPMRSTYSYLLILIVVLIFKVWNLLANWWMLRIRDQHLRQLDNVVRTILNIAVFYFCVKGDMLLSIIVTLLFVIIFLYDFSVARKNAGIAWDLLVAKEHQHMQAFYRLANMATDVPHLQNKVKRRKLLVNLVSHLPFKKSSTFDYLFRITFVRSGDYVGMYVRLIIIGGVIMYFIPNGWVQLCIALVFIYLSNFQMMTLYKHHRTIIWLDLYPVPVENKRHAILKWLMGLSSVQLVIYVGIALWTGMLRGAAELLVIGLLFSYLFIYGYVKKKLI